MDRQVEHNWEKGMEGRILQGIPQTLLTRQRFGLAHFQLRKLELIGHFQIYPRVSISIMRTELSVLYRTKKHHDIPI